MAMSRGPLFGRQKFHPDGRGKLRADPEPDVADLADQIRFMAEQLDPLLLAKAHFAQTPAHFGWRRDLLDSRGTAHSNLIQRAKTWMRTAFAA